MRLSILPLVACLSLSANDWTREDTIRQSAVTLAYLADWTQTRQIYKDPKYFENNRMLGYHPTNATINQHFAMCIVGSYLVARILPPKWRRLWQYQQIGWEVYFVHGNVQIGLRIKL